MYPDGTVFFISFVNLKRLLIHKLLQKRKEASMPCLVKCKTVKSTFCAKRDMKLLTYGDIELNPGPGQYVHDQTILSNCYLSIMLHQISLRPLDVGGVGYCLLELFHISCMVIQVITSGITINILLKAAQSIHGMII